MRQEFPEPNSNDACQRFGPVGFATACPVSWVTSMVSWSAVVVFDNRESSRVMCKCPPVSGLFGDLHRIFMKMSAEPRGRWR